MIHILANPNAGSINNALKTVTDACRRDGCSFSLTRTSRPGHAGEIAASLPLSPDDILAVLGGDGFLNEVVNGFSDSTPCPCPILLYPAGTGNDFVRGVRMDCSPAALSALFAGKAPGSNHVHDSFVVEYDCSGSCTSELFPSEFPDHEAYASPETAPSSIVTKCFNVSCGLGMDAAVCRSLDGSILKKILNRLGLGKLSYTVLGIRQLLLTSGKERTSLRLILDNNDEIKLDNLAFIALHNLPYEGGGFPFAPDADPSDGLLDICAVSVPSRLCLIPLLLASLLGGRHTLFRNWVHMYRSSQAEIFCGKPLPLHTDGEVLCDPAHIRIRPRQIPLSLLYAVRPD